FNIARVAARGKAQADEAFIRERPTQQRLDASAKLCCPSLRRRDSQNRNACLHRLHQATDTEGKSIVAVRRSTVLKPMSSKSYRMATEISATVSSPRVEGAAHTFERVATTCHLNLLLVLLGRHMRLLDQLLAPAEACEEDELPLAHGTRDVEVQAKVPKDLR